MSEQYEPSYYEIALTGRQVLVAFVILLICLVAAFFSGVWVGREEAARAAGPEEAAAEAPAGEPEEPPPPVEEGVEELSFFDDEGGEDGEPAGTSADGGAGAPPTEPARTAGSPDAAETGEPERPESSASEPPREAPERGAERPANPRQTVNPSGALAGGDLVVQVLSSSDQAAAQELLERLRAADFRAFISPLTDGGETFYRVRVGPFEHRSEAERVEAELKRRFGLDTWITR